MTEISFGHPVKLKSKFNAHNALKWIFQRKDQCPAFSRAQINEGKVLNILLNQRIKGSAHFIGIASDMRTREAAIGTLNRESFDFGLSGRYSRRSRHRTGHRRAVCELPTAPARLNAFHPKKRRHRRAKTRQLSEVNHPEILFIIAFATEMLSTQVSAPKPDVILLDVGLPKLNGDTRCAVESSYGPRAKNILIVAMAGEAQEEDDHKPSGVGSDLRSEPAR